MVCDDDEYQGQIYGFKKKTFPKKIREFKIFQILNRAGKRMGAGHWQYIFVKKNSSALA